MTTMAQNQSHHDALLRLLRVSGRYSEACFATPSLPLSTSRASAAAAAAAVWRNDSINSQDTRARFQLRYPGAALLHPSSTAALHIAVTPMVKGALFPSLCVISLGTWDVPGVQEVVVKEWDLRPCASRWRDDDAHDAHDGTVRLSIPLRTIYTVVSLLAPGGIVDAATPLLLTLRFLGCRDDSGAHCIRRVCLTYDQRPAVVPARPPSVAAVRAPTPVRPAPPSPGDSASPPASLESSLIDVSPPSPPAARVRTESPLRPGAAEASTDSGPVHEASQPREARCLEPAFAGHADVVAAACPTFSSSSAASAYGEGQPKGRGTGTPHTPHTPHTSRTSSPRRRVRSPSVASILDEGTHESADAIFHDAPPPQFDTSAGPLSLASGPTPYLAEADVLSRLHTALASSVRTWSAPPPQSSAAARTGDPAPTASLRRPPYQSGRLAHAPLDVSPTSTVAQTASWRTPRGTMAALSPRSTSASSETTADVPDWPHLWTWPTRVKPAAAAAVRAPSEPGSSWRSTSRTDTLAARGEDRRRSSTAASVHWVCDDGTRRTAVAPLSPTTPVSATPTPARDIAASPSALAASTVASVLAAAASAASSPASSARAASSPPSSAAPHEQERGRERDSPTPHRLEHVVRVVDAPHSPTPSSPSPGRPLPPPSAPPPAPPQALTAMNPNVPADYWLSAKPPLSEAARKPVADRAPPPLMLAEASDRLWCLPPSVSFHARKHHATRAGVGARRLTITRTPSGLDARGQPTYVTDIALAKTGVRAKGHALTHALRSARPGRPSRATLAGSPQSLETYSDTASALSVASAALSSSDAGAPRSAKSSQLTVYQGDLVQVFTGDTAYRSGYLHVDRVLSPACCLVLLCNDQLVTAVELESAEEVVLAKTLLSATAVPSRT